jgi:hypothetical protein
VAATTSTLGEAILGNMILGAWIKHELWKIRINWRCY